MAYDASHTFPKHHCCDNILWLIVQLSWLCLAAATVIVIVGMIMMSVAAGRRSGLIW
jgi:hypothetical protein